MKSLTTNEIKAFAQKTYGASFEELEKSQSGVAEATALLHPPILRSLAEGRPISTDELAKTVNRPTEDVERMMPLLPDLERDRDGAITGFGLSLNPTVHKVHLHEYKQTLYAWCVPDALILPSLIQQRATILSPAQDTGEEVTIELTPEKVTRVQPQSAVVSWWVPGMDANDLRATACVNQNLFSSEGGAVAWAAEHEGADIMSVPDTVRALDMVKERLYG